MVRKSNGKISLIAVALVLFLIPIIYIGITYVSATSATYSISGVEFNNKAKGQKIRLKSSTATDFNNHT